MNVATSGSWTGSYSGADIDGVDMWDAIMTNSASPRSEIIHYASTSSTSASVQKDLVKLDYLQTLADVGTPEAVFDSDADPQNANYACSDVSELTGTEEESKPARQFSMGVPSTATAQSSYVALWLFGAAILLGAFWVTGSTIQVLSYASVVVVDFII
jgi:hypothetical protein